MLPTSSPELVADESSEVNLCVDFGNEFTYLAVTILSVVFLSETPTTGPFWIGL